MNNFLQQNYDEIVKMTEKITQDSNYREIAHYVIEQFMQKPKANELIQKGEAMRFLSGMIYRNYYSSNSPYDKLFRAKRKLSLGGHKEYDFTNYDLEWEDYDATDDKRLEAIEGILEDMIGEGFGHIWYIATLFKMWIETPNYSELSRKTLIPRTSIAFAVEECKEYIKQRLKDANID